MVSDTDSYIEKEAGILQKALVGVPISALKGYLSYAIAAGLISGAGAGLLSANIKKKDSKITALKRKKDFYDRQVAEMENQNWLNDLMDTKRKLDTSRLTDEERSELEKKYVELINR